MTHTANEHTDNQHTGAVFSWEGIPCATVGELLNAAFDVERAGNVDSFLAAYRAHTEHADANLGYLFGYIEPPERRRQMYEAFALNHPVFGGVV